MELSAQRNLGADMGQLRGDNVTSGTLGFGSDAVPITALADTGSNMTFVSKKILDKLQDPNIRPAKSISVRLTNGVVTQSSQILRAGIVL